MFVVGRVCKVIPAERSDDEAGHTLNKGEQTKAPEKHIASGNWTVTNYLEGSLFSF